MPLAYYLSLLSHADLDDRTHSPTHTPTHTHTRSAYCSHSELDDLLDGLDGPAPAAAPEPAGPPPGHDSVDWWLAEPDADTKWLRQRGHPAAAAKVRQLRHRS